MVAETIISEGEADLLEKLFESDGIDAVIQEAANRNLKCDRLGMDRVSLDGPWKSTKESTALLPILYLRSEKGYHDHLIVKRPGNEKYCLFRYSWTL